MSLLVAENLVKRYGSMLAIDNVSFSLEAGEPIALIGPNGAGKTTLLSLLCGFIRPTSGSLRVLGQASGSRALVGRIGALPQDASLDPRFSVRRQLTLLARLQGMDGKDAAAEVERVLDVVRLGDAAGKSYAAMSHGMRKRISLAQALLGSPECVLLDEPTAGIDPPNAKIIRDLVRQLSDRTTFLISSHNLDELERLCNRVLYLDNGKLVHSGSEMLEDDTANEGVLTVRLASSVPEAEFVATCRAIEGVVSVQRVAQGDYQLRHVSAAEADSPTSAVDIALLEMLAARGWSYRCLVKGRSLEERLYGEAISAV